MDNLVESRKNDNQELRIFVDEEPTSPREWDNLGTMVCFHSRYDLGDKTDLRPENFNSQTELEEYLRKEEHAKIIMPLYLYDHSGLRIKIGSFYGLLPQGHAEFDSGCIGYIYATREDILENFCKKRLSKKMLEHTEKILKGEVETYDQYLSGDVYSFAVIEKVKCKTCEHVEENVVDSCCGFYGSDWKENGLLEASGFNKTATIEG